MKEKSIEFRENELLDLCPNELTEEVIANKHQRKRIIQKIYKDQQRKRSFRYITKHIGKGTKKSLIRVHEKDDNNQIIKTYIGKEDIEKAIMKYNKVHYTKAHESKVYQDKIYFKLQEDEIRDKILTGRLAQEECDNKEVLWEELEYYKTEYDHMNKILEYKNTEIEDLETAITAQQCK